MKLLVTGGAGFIGSNFIHYILKKYPDYQVVNLDILTYAGNLENLKAVELNPQYTFVKGDIGDYDLVDKIVKDHKVDMIVNFAAESHNSWAIIDPGKFFKTNVLGTQNLLEVARKNGGIRFHHISTCEVYGDLPLDSDKKFTENSPYLPRTPYNASKAASDLAVRVYFDTFKLPVTISNCSNNYGPYQFPEKLIPLFVTNLLKNKKVPVYKNSQNRREWLHVLDHCQAVDLILHQGKIGETYNVGSGVEQSVEQITDFILKELGQPQSMKEYVQDRPGHDRRYLLDASKIKKELGWQPKIAFEQGLKDTIKWYIDNPRWWQPLKEKNILVEGDWSKKK
ncbi:MAG: dTDP-glucose 4,6-dehydratase [Candidatus Komeilibacteria bacterium RIFOXYC1_FULL_37_11]|uniref:dTDP-glucose 4,6-dehydratase n=1 Tax=Candidatus Komeilibacteria bacterium RIFOXYC1_FULL_37_11 TaxID=1798555 RepID=A0A1G2BZT3_9BACT|nr:MAG: dTDP-glucose 4,6-dehydratase [Candidatus Komeilibacteria bacterium RIFOXYC1_FULL_37_11]OGY95462.1 MAG: dTDP-glucose 4,6-dehydratase [Candidatus Komeilibacteria bacterium RIFOXYD1_FULL_37_29]